MTSSFDDIRELAKSIPDDDPNKERILMAALCEQSQQLRCRAEEMLAEWDKPQ